MKEKLIGKAKLSDGTLRAVEVFSSSFALEIGGGRIFIKESDIPAFKKLLQDVDRYFLRR